MLALDDLTVRIGQATLLRGVTAAVRPGCLTAVVGANGAGKTTLLRVASGEQDLTAGTVSMDGVSLGRLSASVQARRRAVLPQHARLGFAFPVFEVVLMGRTPHTTGRRGDARTDAEVAIAALEAVGMAAFAERSYPTLSGGEQQRVHLARALAQIWTPPPESASGGPAPANRYLLLDEPTASLDLAHQHRVLCTARTFAEKGVGVLAVLHDLNLAAQYADHIVVLTGGAVTAQGTPVDVLTPEIIQAAFGVPVLVETHPRRACPLVIADPTGAGADASPFSSSLPSSIPS